MTVMATAEVEAYLHAVTAALSDLGPDVRADLLEDLPDHLAEVAAEGGGSLVERLGDPVAYAAELRAAAVVTAEADAGGSRSDDLARLMRSGAAALERADVAIGRALGYPRLADCLRALQPGWWVLRGWVFAELLSRYRGNPDGGVIPNFGNGYSDSSKVFGLVFLAGCVLASMRIGRASARWSLGVRRVLLAISLLLALYALKVAERTTEFGFSLASSSSGAAAQSAPTTAQGTPITDLYVYDSAGRQVPQARLFDSSGGVVQVGDPYCADGSSQINPDGTPQWVYPLCPSAQGPFRSGPGPLTSGTPSSSGSPAPSASPTPTSGPTPAPTS